MTDRVVLRLEGLMLEKLLELALAEGAILQSVERPDRRHFVIATDCSGAAKLRALCERYHIGCETLAARGLHPLLRRAAHRWTLLVGLLLGAGCLWLCLSRIWIIDLKIRADAPQPGLAAELREALFEAGLSPGAPSRGLDPEALSFALAARVRGCAYVGARLEGIRLVIEAVPEEEAPELFRLDEARDLVAMRDGVIVSVNVKSGQAAVKPGDSVRRGQVLIRGEERVSKEETRGVQAAGEVIARTWYTGEAVGPLCETRRTFTGRISVSRALRLLSWRLPLTEGEPLAPAEAESELLPVGGLFLPLEIERVTQREYVEEIVEADVARLEQTLGDAARIVAEAALEDNGCKTAQIAREWTEYYTTDEGSLRACAVLEVRADIAVTREASYRGGS